MAESPTNSSKQINGSGPSNLLVDSTPPTLAARTKVKGWTVWEPLHDDSSGSGGMHEVLAADAAGACVVLRVPPDAETAERMRAEVEIAQQHPHKSIVQSVGVVEHNNWPVQVIEHVDGMRLDTLLLVGGPLAPEGACRIGWQIGVALAELHGRKPVIHHGALSADRIVIDVEGNARLRDVGRLMPSQALSRMSPERRTMTTPTPSGPDDVYALALIVAEAALGHALDLGESGVLSHEILDGLLSERLVNGLAALLVPEQQRLQNAAAAARVFLEGEYSFGDGQKGLKAAVGRARRGLTAQRTEDPNTEKLDSGEADGFDVHGPVTTPDGVKALHPADVDLDVTSPGTKKRDGVATLTAAPVVSQSGKKKSSQPSQPPTAAAAAAPASTIPQTPSHMALTEDDDRLPAAKLQSATGAAADAFFNTAPADGPVGASPAPAPLAQNARASKSLADQKAEQIRAQKAKASQSQSQSAQSQSAPAPEMSTSTPVVQKSGSGKDVGLFFAFAAMFGVGAAAPAVLALSMVASFGNDLEASMKGAKLDDPSLFAAAPPPSSDDEKAAAALLGAFAEAAKDPKADAKPMSDDDKAAAAFFGALADAAKDPNAGKAADAKPTSDDDKAAAAFFGALADAAKNDPKASDDDKAAAAFLGALADAAKDPKAADAKPADSGKMSDDDKAAAAFFGALADAAKNDPKASDDDKAAAALLGAFAEAAKDPNAAKDLNAGAAKDAGRDAKDAKAAGDDLGKALGGAFNLDDAIAQAKAEQAAKEAAEDKDGGLFSFIPSWHDIKVKLGLEASPEDLAKADDAAKALQAAFADAAKPGAFDAAPTPAPSFATSASARGGALRALPNNSAASTVNGRGAAVNGRGAPDARARAAAAKADKAEQARLDKLAKVELAHERADEARLAKAAKAEAAHQKVEDAKAAKVAAKQEAERRAAEAARIATAKAAQDNPATGAGSSAPKRVKLTVAVDEPSRREAQGQLAKCGVTRNTVGVVHVVVPAGAVKVSSEPHNACVDKVMGKAFYGAFADDEPYELNVE